MGASLRSRSHSAVSNHLTTDMALRHAGPGLPGALLLSVLDLANGRSRAVQSSEDLGESREELVERSQGRPDHIVDQHVSEFNILEVEATSERYLTVLKIKFEVPDIHAEIGTTAIFSNERQMVLADVDLG